MELRAGYKWTEVGSIPENWDVAAIGALLVDFRGGAPLKPSDFTHVGMKVLPKGGVGRVGWLTLSDDDIQYCSHAYADKHPRNKVDSSYTVVVLRDLVPSGPSIGLMVQIRGNETFVLAQGVYGFRVIEQIVSPGYLTQLSNTHWYRKLANSIMVGSTQVHITNTAFKSAQIPLPPKAEQEAIAEALSDADALIESLEQLIAKKRHIKQGAMQELLTGKRRLQSKPVRNFRNTELGDIPADWELDYIEGVAQITTGGRNTQDRVEDGAYPFFVRSQTIERINSYSFDGEAVLTAGDGVGTGKVFHYVNGKFDTHQRVYRISNFDERMNGYYFFLYFSSRFYNRIMQMMAKSSVDSVRREMIAKMLVALPPRDEQEAIAQSLADMDAEIAALETKLAKYRQIKQGMMQQLLTGRIRLV